MPVSQKWVQTVGCIGNDLKITLKLKIDRVFVCKNEVCKFINKNTKPRGCSKKKTMVFCVVFNDPIRSDPIKANQWMVNEVRISKTRTYSYEQQ